MSLLIMFYTFWEMFIIKVYICTKKRRVRLVSINCLFFPWWILFIPLKILEIHWWNWTRKLQLEMPTRFSLFFFKSNNFSFLKEQIVEMNKNSIALMLVWGGVVHRRSSGMCSVWLSIRQLVPSCPYGVSFPEVSLFFVLAWSHC